MHFSYDRLNISFLEIDKGYIWHYMDCKVYTVTKCRLNHNFLDKYVCIMFA